MGSPAATHDPDAYSGPPASRCLRLRLPPRSDITVKKTTVQKPRRRPDFRHTHKCYYCTHRILPQCTTTRNNGWSARRLLSTTLTPTNQHSNRRAREGAARQGAAPQCPTILGFKKRKNRKFCGWLVLPPGRLRAFYFSLSLSPSHRCEPSSRSSLGVLLSHPSPIISAPHPVSSHTYLQHGTTNRTLTRGEHITRKKNQKAPPHRRQFIGYSSSTKT